MAEIKICGLYRACDADYVNEAGPDYAGFILNFPRSHRNLSPEQAKPLRFRLKPQIRAVGVFVDQPQETILEAPSSSVLRGSLRLCRISLFCRFRFTIASA